MKKLLPKTTKTHEGFTLIELLVVIAIIAILSVIGVALFTSTQAKARDSKRVQDITAISKALEVNYVQGSGYPTAISSTWFADGLTPANPTPNGQTYGSAGMTTGSFMICAELENSTGNATSITGAGLGTS